MTQEKGIKFICDLCGQLIEVGRARYIFKGELTCAYDGAHFDETPHTQGSAIEEMKRLIEIAEQKSEKELTDEVHYAFQLDLCASCRGDVYHWLEMRINADKGQTSS